MSDHGAGSSGAVWLMARGAGVGRQGAVGTSEPRHLRDLAPTVLARMGRSADRCVGCGGPIAELFEDPRMLVAR